MGQPLASENFERSTAEERFSSSHGPEDNDNFDECELDSLHEQAERCRRLAGATYNREVSEILGNMADGYERSAAAQLSKKQAGYASAPAAAIPIIPGGNRSE